jgi:hypothetical protein
VFTWLFAVLATLTIIKLRAYIDPRAGPRLRPQISAPVAVNICVSIAATTLFALCHGHAIGHSLYGTLVIPSFLSARLNTFTIAGALSPWKVAGIYGFALGYTFHRLLCPPFVGVTGARVSAPGRRHRTSHTARESSVAKPGTFPIYVGLIALNLIVTRAHATQMGSAWPPPDYCICCVNVVVA